MQPATENGDFDRSLPFRASSPLPPEVEELSGRTLALSPEEKRVILYRLMRDYFGDPLPRDFGIYHTDGTSLGFLVMPQTHAKLSLTPERIAEMDRRAKSGPGRPFSETLARLDAMQ